MSVMRTGTGGHAGAAPEPRVRELARDAFARMAFSAGVSALVALLLVVAHGLGR